MQRTPGSSGERRVALGGGALVSEACSALRACTPRRPGSARIVPYCLRGGAGRLKPARSDRSPRPTDLERGPSVGVGQSRLAAELARAPYLEVSGAVDEARPLTKF